MSMTTPVAVAKACFDAENDATFSFTSNGGDQVIGNILTIYNSSNVAIYTNTFTTYLYEQTLPADTLSNGNQYYFTFKTVGLNGTSSESGKVGFYCLTQATLRISNMPTGNVITDSVFTFNISTTIDSIDTLNSLTCKLYSAGQTLLSSETLYNSNTWTISGLEDKSSYTLKITGITTKQMTLTEVSYDITTNITSNIFESELTLTSHNSDGYIQIQSNIVAVEGECENEASYDSNGMYFVNCGENNYIDFGKGFKIFDEFAMGVWFRPGVFLNGKCLVARLTTKEDSKARIDFSIAKTSASRYYCMYEIYYDDELQYRKVSTTYKTQLSSAIEYYIYITHSSSNGWSIDFTNYSGTYTASSLGDWNESSSNIEWNMCNDLNAWGTSTETHTFADYGTYSSNGYGWTSIKIYNGVYDHLFITKDSTYTEPTSKPTTWDSNTVLICDFDSEDNLNAGNTDFTASKLKSIKIKRRKKGTYNWTTLKEIEINDASSLSGLSLQDSCLPSGYTWQYAIVPVMTSGLESDYTIKEVDTCWNGVFITTSSGTRFKLYNGVAYGGNKNNRQIGSLIPLGNRYPILIQNGKASYLTGTISGDLFGYQFDEDRTIDRASVVEQSQDLLDVLDSGEAICITDWNGNAWIGRVIDSDSISFNKTLANGSVTVSFNFVEQGKYDDETDLINTGFSS